MGNGITVRKTASKSGEDPEFVPPTDDAGEPVMSISDKLGKYLGDWMSVVDEDIVAAGQDAKAVYDKARKKYLGRTPFVMKIPKETVMLL